jgi:circadian clock protein KaiC
VEGLDRLLGGGLERGSVAVISGQSGVGKTTLALQFLIQAAREGGGASVFSLDESPVSMLHRADSLGLPASELMRKGLLTIRHLRPTEMYPAEFARIVQSAALDKGVRAVLIDSLSSYREPGNPQLLHHLSELLDNLSDVGITTFVTVESAAGLTALPGGDPFGVNHFSDNAIVMRFFEAGGRVRRAISVLKKRSGPHESTIRELEFSPQGIRIGAPLAEFNGILTGTPTFIGENPSLFAHGDPDS